MYNERMGMSVEDEQGLFCVEMDAASPTSTYQDYLGSVPIGTKIKNLEGFDVKDTIYTDLSYNEKFGLVN